MVDKIPKPKYKIDDIVVFELVGINDTILSNEETKDKIPEKNIFKI